MQKPRLILPKTRLVLQSFAVPVPDSGLARTTPDKNRPVVVTKGDPVLQKSGTLKKSTGMPFTGYRQQTDKTEKPNARYPLFFQSHYLFASNLSDKPAAAGNGIAEKRPDRIASFRFSTLYWNQAVSLTGSRRCYRPGRNVFPNT